MGKTTGVARSGPSPSEEKTSKPGASGQHWQLDAELDAELDADRQLSSQLYFGLQVQILNFLML